MNRQITAIIVGNGDRATAYAKTALENSELLKIIGVVDPVEFKRKLAIEKYNINPKMAFSDIKELIALGRVADCIINTTMDELHVQIAIPLLELGYDMLIEKPITNNVEDLMKLREVVKRNKNTIMVCHVLRYTPFYKKIKELVLNGEVGEVMHIETNEDVCVMHASSAYIRGKWRNNKACGSSMLLAKCCHDLDLLCWLNDKTIPKNICSFGGRNFLIPEKAPKGAGTRCLVDCPLVDKCQYSAKGIYLENDDYPFYAWDCIDKDFDKITMEEKIESLKTNNIHGICAYKTDADIVDHQTLILEFENGSTASHSMITGMARAGRKIHIMGTEGEIEGFLDGNIFYLRKFCKNCEHNYIEQKFDFTSKLDESDRHFGGDGDLMMDFIKVLQGEKPSISYTSLDNSIYGHLCVYSADNSMIQKKIIKIKTI